MPFVPAPQSLEYLRTGFVTFPRPDAAYLLEIKRGELPYAALGTEIEALLDEVEKAAETSSLPFEPDRHRSHSCIGIIAAASRPWQKGRQISSTSAP